ncbi:MAG: hypothetical protein A2516_11040 [Alphaproteobacteria bacterium RIFOXYD12_FULL_60_8]|nr:MAG: hypothetical protein A2516_11040 [Alphaproteobacteria bacterium RIFOXYD12_FULL_60_8]
MTSKAVWVMAAFGLMFLSAQAGAEGVKSLNSGADITATNAAPSSTTPTVGTTFDRAFSTQPPLIPHVIEDLAINQESNACLGCHEDPTVAPRPSEAHFKDRSGTVAESVDRSRWFCTQCHVPQEDAKPLVDNTFKGALK